MHIHRLQLCAMGPFPGSVDIDFDALGPGALFLIDGPTGAGKSTLIDALVFALYGDVAGSDSDRERLRCDFADPAAQTYAEVEFSTSAGRYRVRRSPEFLRAKVRGQGTTKEKAAVALWRVLGQESVEPISARHGEDEPMITEAIGLTKSQFLQTVVLPQGEFARFLRAESADRQPILERIFATAIYRKIFEEFEQRRMAATRSSEQRHDDFVNALYGLRGRCDRAGLRELVADVELTPHIWPEVRQRLRDVVHQEHQAAQVTQARATSALASATVLAEQATAAHAARQALDSGRRALDMAQGALDQLMAQAPAGSADLASMADEQSAAFVEGKLVQLREVASARDALPKLQEQLDLHTTTRDRLHGELASLEAELHVELPQELAQAAAALHGHIALLNDQARAAQEQVRRLQHERFSGMAYELSQGLHAGDQCPVCGSTDHPAPARVPATVVTAADIAASTDQASSAEEAYVGVTAQAARLIPTDLDLTSITASTAGGGDVQHVLDRLAQVNGRINAAREFHVQLTERMHQVVMTIDQVDADYRVAQAHAHALAEAAGVVGLDLGHEQRRWQDSQQWLDRVRQARDKVTAQREFVEQLAATIPSEALPDLETIQAHLAQAQSTSTQATSDADAARALERAIEQLSDQVEVAYGAWNGAMETAAPLVRICRALSAGPGGQALGAYVVQQAFDEVVDAANARLMAMLGSQFQLVTTQERTGTKRTGLGLGLKVRDLRSDTERRTTTMSGGETFCASLALALGLADCVRAYAGGVEIDTLFIDEGFGALDADLLGDVMNELSRLRADGRTVGIISHVAELKRMVQERIDVQPAASGSVVEVTWMA